MKIAGYIKTSMIDYPNHLSSVVFTPHCNFKCPFCHNRSLVLEKLEYDKSVVVAHLKKRQHILDGVVISGGEPTLQTGLKAFCAHLKAMGFKVKLDTNGSRPDILNELIKYKMVDYIAMDIKNSALKYNLTCQSHIDFDSIKRSIELIKASGIDYEFRTTLMKEFHLKEDIEAIFKLASYSRLLVLQQYKYSEHQIENQSYNSYTNMEMGHFKTEFQVLYKIKKVIVRGRY